MDETEEGFQEIERRIENGSLVWFQAKVEAGVEVEGDYVALGDVYLGGCLYNSVEEFANGEDYHQDLINDVVGEAKEVLKDLKQIEVKD